MHTTDVPQNARRIEELVGKLESAGDPGLVSMARDLVQSLMELHFAGLKRMMEIAARTEHGQEMIDQFGSDDLIGSLLALYELHPLDLETRVRKAIEKAQARNRGHSGGIELLGMDDGVVRIRLRGGGTGCGSGTEGLRQAIEDALYEMAPDISGLAVETVDDRPAAFVPLESLTGIRGTIVKGAGV